MTALITSQQINETLGLGTPSLRASQIVVETLDIGLPAVRASQIVAEALSDTTPRVRASQIVVEVLLATLEVPVLPIYPSLPGLTYDSKWSPQFFNMATATTDTGADIDLGFAEWPLHDFELTYSVLRNNFNGYVDPNYHGTEFKTMMGFYLMMRGTLGRCLYLNPDDNSVTGQAVAVADGVATIYAPLQRTFGVADYNSTEPVGVVITTETLNVYLDAVLQDPSTYTIITTAPMSQQLKFNSAPTNGAVITIDMSYYYYCKLPDNANTFEKFMDQLWLFNKIVLHSCRLGA